ncbi:MAG: MATE family efflux transporter, partial [Clostridia bacterium]|nr:MATE family efflux transporter [Clostridia bacterium]
DHFSYARLLRFCAPTMGMMVFTSIYFVVDAFFISNYAGKEAFAGVSLILPVLTAMAALGMMTGMGGTALVSKVFGEGDRDRAQRYFSMVIEFTLIFSTILGLIVAFFMKDIVLALGATPEIMDYAVIYGRIGSALNFLYTMQYMFQSLMGVAERPNLALTFTVAAGFLNVFLDWLFVCMLDFGVAGAAAASSISEVAGGLAPLVYFTLPNSTDFRFFPVIPEFMPMLKAMVNGLSELMNTLSFSIVTIAYNFQLLKYSGSDGVAAYGVVINIVYIFLGALIGITMGAVPIVSYHFGARNHHELNNLLRKVMVIEFCCGALMFILSQLTATPLSMLFTGYDPGLQEMTEYAFRLFVTGFFLAGVNTYTVSFFTALNNGLISGVLSIFRALIIPLTAVLIMPALFGLNGIWWTQLITEVLSLIVMVAALLRFDRDYHYLRP